MIEWHFELIYFNSKRMHIDTADGIITSVISVATHTRKQAENKAESIAEQDILTKDGWYARVTICDATHANKIMRIQNGDIVD